MVCKWKASFVGGMHLGDTLQLALVARRTLRDVQFFSPYNSPMNFIAAFSSCGVMASCEPNEDKF